MNVHYDAKDGIGSVPDNQVIDYKGFKAWMSPDMFLKLAYRIYLDPQDTRYLYLKNAIKHGKPIGPPFLSVSWDASKKVWAVGDHEGRHRVQAIKDLWPNESIEVHIFPGSGIRARDITPDMLQSFMNGIFAEDKTFVKNPTSEIEWKGQKITPQSQQGETPPPQASPMFETQLQKSRREINEFEKIGPHVKKMQEYFGVVKKNHTTGKSTWVCENKKVQRIIDLILEVENLPIKQRLSKAHDKLYQQFQKIIDKEKPCKFDKSGQCVGSRAGNVPKKGVCCHGCGHHGKKGCTTQALGCKSWMCGDMERNFSPEALKQWRALQNKTHQSGMWAVRAPKEQEIQYALQKIRDRIDKNRRKKWVANYMAKNPGVNDYDAYTALLNARDRGENI